MTSITAAVSGGAWTSGGTWTGGVAPTAADNAVLDATSGNVTVDTGAVARSLDCTGYTGTLTHTAAVTLTLGDATAGAGNVALKLAAGMTYALGSATTSAIAFVSTSATQQTITAGGKTLGNWTVGGAGGSYLLTDANTVGTTSTVTVSAGTLNTGGQSCSWGNFSSVTTNTRSVTLGASSITITAAAGTFDLIPATGLTLSAASSTITFTGGSGYLRANGTYGTLAWSAIGSNAQSQAFTCTTLTLTGSASKTADFTALGNITVIGTLTIAGNSATNRLRLHTSTLATPRTVSAATVAVSNADLLDIAAAGAASWDLSAATGGSGDCGGNTGIVFTTPVTQTHTASAGGTWSDATKWTSRVPLPQDDVVIDVNTTGTVTADMPRLGHTLDFTGFAGTCAFNSVANAIFGGITLASGMTISGTQVLTLSGRGVFALTSAGKSYTQAITLNAGSSTYSLRDPLTTAGALTLTLGVLAANGNTVTYGSLSQTNGILASWPSAFLWF
jgi:hypothetical protein